MGSTVLWPTAEGGKRAPKLSWPSTRHELTLDLIAAAITLRLESPPSNHLQAAPVSPQPLQWGPWAEVGKDSSTCTLWRGTALPLVFSIHSPFPLSHWASLPLRTTNSNGEHDQRGENGEAMLLKETRIS
ncbi:hypothetical protein SAY87_003951 [Trapa incisa]|uniref:Uncharacterized protein n=1 Tax=Trapa incisa TaxID=236973 RepID=A0AAN7PL53_9MYRT|nr:hypothetical protein SAY87_003951 [Trapa incisa]